METAKIIREDIAFAKEAMLKSKKNFIISGLIIAILIMFFPLIVLPSALLYYLVILKDDEKKNDLNLKNFLLNLFMLVFFSITNAFSLVFKSILVLIHLKNLDPPHYTHES